MRPQDLAGGASLWDLLDRQGVRISAVDKTVEASLADDYEANALDIAAGALFLVVETVAFAADGTAIEANRVSYRGDRHKLFFHQAGTLIWGMCRYRRCSPATREPVRFCQRVWRPERQGPFIRCRRAV